ncbi:MAG: hypothetical protein ABSB70_11740 [Candidatus Velthaea sp.]
MVNAFPNALIFFVSARSMLEYRLQTSLLRAPSEKIDANVTVLDNTIPNMLANGVSATRCGLNLQSFTPFAISDLANTPASLGMLCFRPDEGPSGEVYFSK